jgi:hypothetical protein
VSRALGALVIDGTLRHKGRQLVIAHPEAIRTELQPTPSDVLVANGMPSRRHLRLVVSNA